MVCASQFAPIQLVNILELLRIFAAQYVQTSVYLDVAIFSLERRDIWKDKQLQELLLVQMDTLGTICVDCDLPVTRKLVDKIIFALTTDPPPVLSPVFAGYLKDLRERFISELETKLFFQVHSSRAVYFDSPWSGWEEIRDRWQDSTGNIEEMNKCFALSRYPACVFHSLLVVEFGLIDLGRALRVNDPKPGWDATCNKMKLLLDAGHNKYTLTTITFSDLEQVNHCAQTMKFAWRNKINHAAGQLIVLQPDFAPDVAQEIMTATRGFMRRLNDALH